MVTIHSVVSVFYVIDKNIGSSGLPEIHKAVILQQTMTLCKRW